MTSPSEAREGAVLMPGGELVNLREASDSALAECVDRIAQERDRLAELQALVSDELIARMDRAATWTQRLRFGGAEWELKSASPTAGTTAYVSDALAEGLAELVASGEITTEAASRACKRTVAVEFAVPWGAEPSEVAERLMAALALKVDNVLLNVNAAKPEIKATVSGTEALAKTPAAAEVIEQCRVEVAPKPRRLALKRLGDRSAR